MDKWSAPVCLERENLPGFQLADLPAVLAMEQRSPTVAPGRARYGGTAPREGKRMCVASPGLSPNNKEARVEGGMGSGLGDVEGEDCTSETQNGTSDLDRNVTARRSRQKTCIV